MVIENENFKLIQNFANFWQKSYTYPEIIYRKYNGEFFGNIWTTVSLVNFRWV